MPWLHRHIGNPFLTWALNKLFSGRIEDAHCGLRSIKASSYRQLDLKTAGMEFASEFLVEAMNRGLRIDQAPIRYRRRTGGQPKLRTFRDGLRHLRLLISKWGADGDGRSSRWLTMTDRGIDADRLRI
jgi:hypothetical protein